MAELSVIVPIHNTEPYLPQCLKSILEQTYRDFELILVDDGSDDGCPVICDRAAEKDRRIRVIHQAAGGASAAREAGLRAASGEFVTFPDSDDWLDPPMFETLMTAIRENGADLAAVGFLQEGPEPLPRGNGIASGLYNLERPAEEKANNFLQKTLYNGTFYEPGIIPSLWSKVIRRKLLDQEGAPNPLIRMGDDAARLYPALAKAKHVLVMNEARHYHYRYLPTSQANAYDPRYFERADALLRGLDKALQQAPEIRSGLPYYALFILELGMDQYLFHARRNSKAEKEAALNQAFTVWEAIRPADGAIRWDGFSQTQAEKLRLFTEGETGKLISLYAKHHFSATIRAVLHRGRTE